MKAFGCGFRENGLKRSYTAYSTSKVSTVRTLMPSKNSANKAQERFRRFGEVGRNFHKNMAETEMIKRSDRRIIGDRNFNESGKLMQ